jgi:predicted alternative tryptophan synthase beta-subunit
MIESPSEKTSLGASILRRIEFSSGSFLQAAINRLLQQKNMNHRYIVGEIMLVFILLFNGLQTIAA